MYDTDPHRRGSRPGPYHGKERRRSRSSAAAGTLGVVRRASRKSLPPHVRKQELCLHERQRYRGLFAALAQTPSEEIAIVRSLSVPW